jgi:hypothetical protein
LEEAFMELTHDDVEFKSAGADLVEGEELAA